MLALTIFSLYLQRIWGNPCPRHIEIKEALCLSCDWEPRKFTICTQGWHSGSHAIAWAAIHMRVQGFPRTSNQNMAYQTHVSACITALASGLRGHGRKKSMRKISIVVMLILSCLNAVASGVEEIDGLRYLLLTDNKEATLIAGNNYSGDIVVPEKITASDGIEYTVVAFGDECFKASDLTSITIPATVTSLGKSCFSYCHNITEVKIPSSITSFGERCFESCSILKSVNIPSSVTSISDQCFYNCKALTDITIPASVTSLGNFSFSGCSSLSNIDIPSSVTSLGNGCFDGCSKFTSITIPDMITSLGGSLFYNCKSLTSITIPSSVTSIGNLCFGNCSSLTNISIPSTLTFLGDACFNGCSSLTSITIPSTVTSLREFCFSGCSITVIRDLQTTKTN